MSVKSGEQLVLRKLHSQPGRFGDIRSDTNLIREELTDWLYHELKGVVLSGPFQGMKLLRETAWESTHLPPLLLGSYEYELHGEIERQLTRLKKIGKPRISVVGCAEGFYAIGFKLRLSKAEVFAIDSDDNCLRVCKEAAALNVVELRYGAPVPVFMDADLIFMDVEGAEIAYLDPARLPNLREKHIIVEVHDYGEKQPTPRILLERFRGSHYITNVVSGGPRVPNCYPQIMAMHEDYQYLALCEGRPSTMSWFVMEPKGSALS